MARPIDDQNVGLDASVDVNVAGNFSDADNDALTFTAASGDATKATVTVSGSVLTITGEAEGSAGITVTATDPSGASVQDEFDVTVSAANHDPTVARPIDDQNVGLDASVDVNVAGNFSDADNDALTFTAASDDATKATVTVSGSVLTITGEAEGSAGITVTATDPSGASASDAFDVTVSAANHDPTVASPIGDQTVEVGGTKDVDVATNFSDADNDALTFTAASDDATKATVTVSGSVLTITGEAEGSAGITVTATDPSGASASDAFMVTVGAANGENEAPEVDTEIADQTVEVGATKGVDVATNFSDADNDALTFTAASDDATKATVAVSGSMLTITGVAAGSAEITVTADDGNGGTVEDAFDVTVTPTSPAIILSVTEATVRENSEAAYTVRLATQPATDVTVSIGVAAAAGSDDVVTHVTTSRDNNPLIFTNSNWGTARTVLIQVADDTNEDTEIAELTHTTDGGYGGGVTAVLTVTAADDDVVAGAAIVAAASVDVVEGAAAGADLMVKLSAEPTDDVVVAATLDPAGVATITTGVSLTFTTTDWQTEQAITITATEDDDPVDAMTTLTLAASGGGYGSADDVEVEVNVDDDEDATISIADGVSGAEVIEGGTMTYDVTLSARPPANQTVRVNLSVTGPASVTPAQAEFTSTTNNNSVTITVTPFSDSDSDDESVTISHIVDASDGSGYENATAPSNVSVTIKDDGAAGVVVSRTALSVEEDGTATYTVRLTTAPASGETVTINLAGTGVNLGATSLTFDDGNFGSPQDVTVTGHVDGDDGDDAATVVHTVTSGDDDYDGVTASTVNITVKEPSDE